LRQYVSAQGTGKRLRAKKADSNRSEPDAQKPRETPEREAQPPQPSIAAAPKPEPQPMRESWTPRPRGPRIADPKNL
jgi:hypothetical protein